MLTSLECRVLMFVTRVLAHCVCYFKHRILYTYIMKNILLATLQFVLLSTYFTWLSIEKIENTIIQLYFCTVKKSLHLFVVYEKYIAVTHLWRGTY